jgi:hypothetical protein
LPGNINLTRVLGEWLEELNSRFVGHNTEYRGHPAVRVRVGIHAGPVRHDEHGLVGAAVNIACRLTELQIAKDVLRGAKASMIIIISDHLYQSVVRHGGRFIDPADYAAVPADLPEQRMTAWLRVPGHGDLPRPVAGVNLGTPVPSRTDPQHTEPSAQYVTNNNGTVKKQDIGTKNYYGSSQ